MVRHLVQPRKAKYNNSLHDLKSCGYHITSQRLLRSKDRVRSTHAQSNRMASILRLAAFAVLCVAGQALAWQPRLKVRAFNVLNPLGHACGCHSSALGEPSCARRTTSWSVWAETQLRRLAAGSPRFSPRGQLAKAANHSQHNAWRFRICARGSTGGSVGARPAHVSRAGRCPEIHRSCCKRAAGCLLPLKAVS